MSGNLSGSGFEINLINTQTQIVCGHIFLVFHYDFLNQVYVRVRETLTQELCRSQRSFQIDECLIYDKYRRIFKLV